MLPDYEHAYDLVVTDTDRILQSTKSLVKEMGQEQLRTMSKPSQDLEDIFAAIIMIGMTVIIII